MSDIRERGVELAAVMCEESYVVPFYFLYFVNKFVYIPWPITVKLCHEGTAPVRLR